MTGKKGKSGGAREGAGRKPTGRTKQSVVFYISPEVLEDHDATVPAGQRRERISFDAA